MTPFFQVFQSCHSFPFFRLCMLKIVFRYLQRKSTQLTKFWEESKKQTIVTWRSSQIWSFPWTGSGELLAVCGRRGLILRCSDWIMSLGLKSTSSNSPAGEWQNSRAWCPKTSWLPSVWAIFPSLCWTKELRLVRSTMGWERLAPRSLFCCLN